MTLLPLSGPYALVCDTAEQPDAQQRLQKDTLQAFDSVRANAPPPTQWLAQVRVGLGGA
jgi:hypothetical protein